MEQAEFVELLVVLVGDSSCVGVVVAMGCGGIWRSGNNDSEER